MIQDQTLTWYQGKTEDPRAQTTLGEKGRGSGKERIRKWTENLLKRDVGTVQMRLHLPGAQTEAGAGS